MIGQPGHSGCSATHRKAIMAFEVARMAFEVARPGGSRTMQQSGMLMACGSSGHPTTNREGNPGVRVGNTKRLSCYGSMARDRTQRTRKWPLDDHPYAPLRPSPSSGCVRPSYPAIRPPSIVPAGPPLGRRPAPPAPHGNDAAARRRQRHCNDMRRSRALETDPEHVAHRATTAEHMPEPRAQETDAERNANRATTTENMRACRAQDTDAERDAHRATTAEHMRACRAQETDAEHDAGRAGRTDHMRECCAQAMGSHAHAIG